MIRMLKKLWSRTLITMWTLVIRSRNISPSRRKRLLIKLCHNISHCFSTTYIYFFYRFLQLYSFNFVFENIQLFNVFYISNLFPLYTLYIHSLCFTQSTLNMNFSIYFPTIYTIHTPFLWIFSYSFFTTFPFIFLTLYNIY